MRLWALAALVSLLALAGCTSKLVLESKPAGVPDGVDLSGQWQLRDSTGTEQNAARETLVHVFLESGKSLKVTQTTTGLFVSFDRSIVEEYRFGENREVSVGEISAQRVSGWVDNSYVIETLDESGARLEDAYRLDDSGRELKRRITIWSRDRSQMSIEQVFDRT